MSRTNIPRYDAECVITDGVYGDDSSTSTQFVQFAYQVEIVKGSTTPIDTIISSIEVVMTEAVLPLLFGPNCQSATKLAIGVSTYPTDMVVNESTFHISHDFHQNCHLTYISPPPTIAVTCEVALVHAQDTCAVVDAVFTIYTNDTFVDSDEVISVITNAANTGAFDNAHEDVVKVTVIEVSTDGLEGGSTGPTPSPAGTGSSRLGLGMYLGVAAGALVVLGAAIFYRRRKNQANVDADSTIMTPNAAAGIEVPTGEATEPVYDLGSIHQ
jgi:hypothetical protein